MAQNIKINGVTYNSVSSLSIPLNTGGGNAVFPDTSDATAEAGDIAEGKTAYVGGSKVTGTATGGGGSGTGSGYATGTYTVSEDKTIGISIDNALKIDTGLSDVKFFAFYKNTRLASLSEYELISGIWIYNNGNYYGIRYQRTSTNYAYYALNANNQYTGNNFYNEGNGVMSIKGCSTSTIIVSGTEYVWFAI